MDELLLIKSKVAKLISAYTEIVEEVAILKEKNDYLSSSLEEKNNEAKELSEELNRAKFSGAVLGKVEKSQIARKRINDLVREIDNCLALLNNI